MQKQSSNLPMVGSLICVGAFIYLASFLVKHAIPLNLATWVLWTILDIFLAYSMFKAKDPSKWTTTAFAIGAGVIAYIAWQQLAQGKTHWVWTYRETITLVCFSVAFTIRLFSASRRLAMNLGTTAMLIAGAPTIYDAWQAPNLQNPWFWGTCTFGCFVVFLGSKKGFTAKYFPVGGLILNGTIAALAMRLIR